MRQSESRMNMNAEKIPGKKETPFVEIFTDGACSGNPGVGGFGAILRHNHRETEISGCEVMTTNNRMELTAVIRALEKLKRPCRVRISTDSDYVVRGMTSWIFQWLKTGWKNSKKHEVLNRDLWERLLDISGIHSIEWQWIRGHNAHTENERCDALAKRAISECKKNCPGV